MSIFDRLISWSLPAVPRAIVRRFSSRYIAGTTTDEAFDRVRALRSAGTMVTLDILGEFTTEREQTRRNADAYLDLLRKIQDSGFSETNVSIKLTALGLQLDPEYCHERIRDVIDLAESLNTFVRIDMEDSPCTDDTLDIYSRLRERHPENVGIVLQARLRRSLADIDTLCTRPASFRLCKGIYLEPTEIAHTDFQAIRDNFVACLRRMFEHGAYVGIATHDEWLVEHALELIREFELPPERYEFQMLLGVRERLRDSIIREGHRLRVYVPYGEQWYAYSVRRLRENPQIAGYAFRSLFTRD